MLLMVLLQASNSEVDNFVVLLFLPMQQLGLGTFGIPFPFLMVG